MPSVKGMQNNKSEIHDKTKVDRKLQADPGGDAHRTAEQLAATAFSGLTRWDDPYT